MVHTGLELVRNTKKTQLRFLPLIHLLYKKLQSYFNLDLGIRAKARRDEGEVGGGDELIPTQADRYPSVVRELQLNTDHFKSENKNSDFIFKDN